MKLLIFIAAIILLGSFAYAQPAKDGGIIGGTVIPGTDKTLLKEPLKATATPTPEPKKSKPENQNPIPTDVD